MRSFLGNVMLETYHYSRLHLRKQNGWPHWRIVSAAMVFVCEWESSVCRKKKGKRKIIIWETSVCAVHMCIWWPVCARDWRKSKRRNFLLKIWYIDKWATQPKIWTHGKSAIKRVSQFEFFFFSFHWLREFESVASDKIKCKWIRVELFRFYLSFGVECECGTHTLVSYMVCSRWCCCWCWCCWCCHTLNAENLLFQSNRNSYKKILSSFSSSISYWSFFSFRFFFTSVGRSFDRSVISQWQRKKKIIIIISKQI